MRVYPQIYKTIGYISITNMTSMSFVGSQLT